jgi:glyoxylase-like metal-dependent hydrolase (beta-lactamase superfamily II)
MITVKSFAFNPIQENTYVLFNDKDACCIIDPGCYFGNERKELETFISGQGLNPKILLNTHCHLDHVFGNKFVGERYNLTLHIHEKEKQVLEYAPAAGLKWNMPFENYRGELKFLEEGDLVSLDDDVLQVLFTPGHSPGSICFYSEKQKFVIGGDVLFRQGIGRTDLPGGDHDTLLNSIHTRLFTLPDDVIVYSGHGEPTTVGYEKKSNPFLK